MTQNTEERTLAAITHGRYLLDRGTAGAGAPLLVGFHGYGENADRHLEKLRRIPGAEGWLLCAVGALHPFYNTKTGEVLGCWMTRQSREQAIDDNIRYAASVVAEVRRRERPSERLVYAGFSQGVAMMYRAAARGGFACHGLLALAGDVPPELAGAELPGAPPVLLGRGTEDPLYTEETMARDLEVLAQLGMAVTTCVFEGGHVWSAEYYRAAGELLRRVREGS